MAKTKRQRMYRVDPYQIFILSYSLKQARNHFKEQFPEKGIKKIRWFTFRKNKIQFDQNAN